MHCVYVWQVCILTGNFVFIAIILVTVEGPLENVYACGDCATFEVNPLPQTAQVCVYVQLHVGSVHVFITNTFVWNKRWRSKKQNIWHAC